MNADQGSIPLEVGSFQNDSKALTPDPSALQHPYVRTADDHRYWSSAEARISAKSSPSSSLHDYMTTSGRLCLLLWAR